uniref:Uncharacterized protein n=1 Tax=Physcomitrium patens TaxID=3218 RepID=A0A2K1IS50_PHYPA|nr:hypothetical protein PHYPA_026234 [Physcomitrium patens]
MTSSVAEGMEHDRIYRRGGRWRDACMQCPDTMVDAAAATVSPILETLSVGGANLNTEWGSARCKDPSSPLSRMLVTTLTRPSLTG